MNVLLIDGENVQSICIARSLSEDGHRVILFANSRISSGYVSRYMDERHIVPDIIHNQLAFEKYFYHYLSSENVDVIIPMGDEGAMFLSRNKEYIEGKYSCKCAVPTSAVFDVANNKQRLMELCKRHNLPHPRTKSITIDSISDAVRYVGLPAMIKPDISAGAKGIVKVESIEEIEDKLPNIIAEFGPSTLQEYVEHSGYYYNVMIYRNKKGEISAYTIIRIMRFFPIKGGSSCYCQTIEHDYLLSVCKKTLELLNWTGFADFDILEDAVTGEVKIIEINPRVPSSLQASSAAGVDFAKIIVADEMCLAIPQYKYIAGKEIRWFGLDVMWFLFSKQRFTFKPSWFNFFGANVSYQDGSFKDPLPMIVGCFAGVIKYLNPRYRKSKFE